LQVFERKSRTSGFLLSTTPGKMQMARRGRSAILNLAQALISSPLYRRSRPSIVQLFCTEFCGQ
jgi:hypothetical protein